MAALVSTVEVTPGSIQTRPLAVQAQSGGYTITKVLPFKNVDKAEMYRQLFEFWRHCEREKNTQVFLFFLCLVLILWKKWEKIKKFFFKMS